MSKHPWGVESFAELRGQLAEPTREALSVGFAAEGSNVVYPSAREAFAAGSFTKAVFAGPYGKVHIGPLWLGQQARQQNKWAEETARKAEDVLGVVLRAWTEHLAREGYMAAEELETALADIAAFKLHGGGEETKRVLHLIDALRG